MAKIRVTVGGKVELELELDRELTVGRKEPADIVIADGQVSSRHAVIRPHADGATVTDLGSTNGTRIDDGRLAAHASAGFRRGQKLVIGPAVIEFLAEAIASDSGFGTSEKTVVVGAGSMQELLVQIARFKASHARLVVAAEHVRRVIEITEMESTVGRDSQAGVQIAISHQSISSTHARIKFEGGKYHVEDAGSANGTFVEGNRISGLTPLESQTAIAFGTVDCLFCSKAPEAGGAAGGADPAAELLCEHAVRMGKATPHQSRDVLSEHRQGGVTLGELFVLKGVFTPREWSDVYRQRSILASLRTTGGSTTRSGSRSRVARVVVVASLLAGLAVVGWKLGWFGGAGPR